MGVELPQKLRARGFLHLPEHIGRLIGRHATQKRHRPLNGQPLDDLSGTFKAGYIKDFDRTFQPKVKENGRGLFGVELV